MAEARVCDFCGSPLGSSRADARYCSTLCRVADHRFRNAPRNDWQGTGHGSPVGEHPRLSSAERWFEKCLLGVRGSLEATIDPRLARDVRAQGERALALLESGLGRYAVKPRTP
jgi:hypothetical protein